MEKLLIIDTFNFLHRAYHALPKTFTDSNGEPVNAVYGVTSMVIGVLDSIKPDYMIAALDGMLPTFRVETYTGYKAHRKPMEEDLSSQIPKVFEILSAFGIKQILVEGYEADDVIGTMAKQFSSDVEVVIISSDRDLWQLVGDNVTIMVPGKAGQLDVYGPREVTAKLGFDRNLVPDYKGLRGDPSDNIPGVYGIGEKSASGLISTFGSIDEIYKNIDQVTPVGLRNKLLNSYEQAIMSRDLAKIILDVPVTVSLQDCKYFSYNKVLVKEVLEKYHFKSLIRRLGFEPKEPSKNEEVASNQRSLFD